MVSEDLAKFLAVRERHFLIRFRLTAYLHIRSLQFAGELCDLPHKFCKYTTVNDNKLYLEVRGKTCSTF